jgi:hypothetical protein
VANVLSVFVSSSCHELRDLRASVRDLLKDLEINPQLSEDPAFPRTAGDKPYVTCLRTLTECPLVIGLLERSCGQPMTDWRPFPEYNGLRPTHAELRHALKTNKKLLLYVHENRNASPSCHRRACRQIRDRRQSRPAAVKPYWIKTANGDMIAAADNEVEALIS